jgi:4-aminobutyrate aminotransferase
MSYSRNLPKSIKMLHPNIFPKSAKGSWIESLNGKMYLDFTSGIGALSTGHSHTHVINKIIEQAHTYVHMPQQLFNIHTMSNEFTGKLLSIMPNESLNSVFYVNSGSEATDNAIKIARSFTKKQNIITMKKGFHGRTYGALSVTSSNLTCKKNINPMLSGVHYCDANNIKSFRDILTYQTSPEEVACVIYEPVQGEGGIYSLNSDFLKEIHEICNENNIITIADEVQCGFGRTGTFWNVEQKSVIPDILTFGKGIASGFPLAGLVSSNNIMNNIGTNFLGGTYGGNAISLAAASATYDIMYRENILKNVDLKSELLYKELVNYPCIKSLRVSGLMIGIEFFFSDNPEKVRKIVDKMNKRNILILTCGDKGQYIRLLPPLNVGNTECEIFLNTFREVIDEVC